LVAVIGVAVAGRERSAAPAPTLDAPVVDASSPVMVIADADAVPTPSHRSDWPAAIGRPGGAEAAGQRPTHRAREEGTDGLMGSLPFGIPGDTPYPRGPLVNRFTIDDGVQAPRPFRATPPWIRRNGALTS
jgi:hypothetical protein